MNKSNVMEAIFHDQYGHIHRALIIGSQGRIRDIVSAANHNISLISIAEGGCQLGAYPNQSRPVADVQFKRHPVSYMGGQHEAAPKQLQTASAL